VIPPEKRGAITEPALTPEQLREDAMVLYLVETIGSGLLPESPTKKDQTLRWSKTLSTRDGMSLSSKTNVLNESEVIKNWWADGKLHTNFHLVLDNLTIDGFSFGSISHRPGIKITDSEGNEKRGKEAIKDVISAIKTAERRLEITPIPNLNQLRAAMASRTVSRPRPPFMH